MAKKIHKISISQVMTGHIKHCQAQAFSPNTIADYKNTFRHFLNYLSNPDIAMHKISVVAIEGFLQHMDSQPINACRGVTASHASADNRQRRKPKTIKNYHIALSSLWSYATKRKFASENIMKHVPPPRVPETPIEPLTAAEVAALFHVCSESRPWRTRPLTTNYRSTASRDKAILAIFVETGLRRQELCDVRVDDVELVRRGGTVTVREGKGRKKRVVPFGAQCGSLIHDWLVVRGEAEPDDPLFINMTGPAKGKAMSSDVVGRLVKRLGKKAGIQRNVGPHLLRTTAACMLAANGITAIELQRIMGHSSIETTLRYIRAAQIDVAEAMRRASPLNNLRL